MKKLKWLALIIPRAVRSILLSRHVSNSHPFFAIRVSHPFMKVVIKKARGAKFILNGTMIIDSFFGAKDHVYIELRENSRLVIDGDLIIGNGTQIFIDKEAELYIGGKKHESAAGITERSRIMVRKKVHIGVDTIIAWGVYITDCDWHAIENQPEQADVYIGDHVWIATNATILKGSYVGTNCIVAANAVVSNNIIPEGSMVGGVPARIVKEHIQWRRDLSE